MALPSLDTLRCFEAAARLPSFRAAARSIGITPAALSQRVKGLEARLGTRLFERSTRSRALTDAGRALLPRARAAIEAAIACTHLEPAPVEIALGATPELGLSWLLPARKALQHDHPTLRLSLRFGAPDDVIARLRRGALDCAVLASGHDDGALATLRLARQEHALVGSPRLLSRTPLARDSDAARHTLLDPGDGSAPLACLPSRDALRFARVVEAGSVEGARRLALSGEGVAVLPLPLVRDDLAKGRLRRALPGARPTASPVRLFWRMADARQGLYAGIGGTLKRIPLG